LQIKGHPAKPSWQACAADRDGRQGANRRNSRSYSEDLQRRRLPESADARGATGFAERPVVSLHAERQLARLFAVGLALLLLAGAWQCRHGWPLSFDLLSLIPKTSVDPAQAPLRQQALARVQAPLSRQILALVGHDDAEAALASAQKLAARWRASGLYSQVELVLDVDLAALRTQLLQQRLSLLPEADRERLLHDPGAWAQQRARELTDPFSSAGLVPLSQDWLGLTRRSETALQPIADSALHYDLASSTLQTEHAGKTWLLLRANSRIDALNAGDHEAARQGLLEHMAQDRIELANAGGELLVAGGPLYAASGRAQAITEVSVIGTGATLGIVLLLLLALRRARALLALVPVAVGMLVGVLACVLVFGSIHILTLVIGASLIGVAVDFPLHWLGKSYGLSPWQAQPALRRVLPGLTMSLAASLIGYLALLFTPFIALRQTAVFSAAGLLGAYACTVCVLPLWLRRWQPRPYVPLLRLAQAMLCGAQWLRRRLISRRITAGLTGLMLAAGALGGISRLSLHDDMRLWLNLPSALLQQAQRIGDLTGLTPTSQFFLVQADDADELLRRQTRLAHELDALVQRGVLDGYQALSQRIAPVAVQSELAAHLARWAQQPEYWQALTDIGVPWPTLHAELQALQHLPPITIDEALQGPQDEHWRSLWLGRSGDQVAGLVTLSNLRDAAALQSAASRFARSIDGVTWVDPSGELNQLFADTRSTAAELKLLSYLAAALLLGWGLGRAAIWRILTPPLLAVVASLAVLGWLGQPLTLFGLFGLLLVSALGVDYAIFMYEGVAGPPACLVGIVLSAATTLLSFGLLALSQTPAIANFGLSITLGVAFSLLLTLWVSKPDEPSPATP